MDGKTVVVWKIPTAVRRVDGRDWRPGFEIPLGYFNVDAAAAVMAVLTSDLVWALNTHGELRTEDHFAQYL